MLLVRSWSLVQKWSKEVVRCSCLLSASKAVSANKKWWCKKTTTRRRHHCKSSWMCLSIKSARSVSTARSSPSALWSSTWSSRVRLQVKISSRSKILRKSLDSSSLVSRLSLSLFLKVSPSQLPSHLRTQLERWKTSRTSLERLSLVKLWVVQIRFALIKQVRLRRIRWKSHDSSHLEKYTRTSKRRTSKRTTLTSLQKGNITKTINHPFSLDWSFQLFNSFFLVKYIFRLCVNSNAFPTISKTGKFE